MTGIRPSVYLRGCEGSIWIDDVYLGPVAKLPAPPRQTVPLAIASANGRFTDWPRFASLDFRPNAHVFHLGDLQIGIEADLFLFHLAVDGGQLLELFVGQPELVGIVETHAHMVAHPVQVPHPHHLLMPLTMPHHGLVHHLRVCRHGKNNRNEQEKH